MSTVAKKVIMGSGAVAEFGIDQSLIFDETRGSFLGRASSAISAGNQRTFTFSTWVKLCSKPALANNTHFMMARPTAGGGPLFSIMVLGTEKQLYIFEKNNSSVTRWALQCSAVLRDPAAWYHIVVAIDTTQAANANKVKPYINGVLQTSFVTAGYPDQNDQMPWNGGAVPQYLGWNVGSSGDFYMAETHSIDGAAKAASDFGETNEDTGQWIPKRYSGSYGTNGFYLKFVSGAIGTDSSGEGNNYTATNLTNADVVTDTPNNNFCTLNPLDNALPALLEGNTNTGTAGANSWKMARSTFELTTGKWYWEMKWTGNTVNSTNGYQMGLKTAASTLTAAAQQAGSYAFQATEIFLTAGSLNTVTISPGSATTGQNDIIMFAYDADAGKMWIGVNGTWTSSGNPAAGSNNQWASIPTTGVSPFAGVYGSNISVDCNFGQKTYAYTPPSGFNAISTANLPDPAIPLSSAHFNTVLYAGTGSAQTISGVGFQPDFSWTKCRSAATWHRLVDAVRGSNKEYFSNDPYAEVNSAGGARAMTFESDGFAWGGNSGDVNGSGRNYVSWNWKANGAGSTDTSGDIDATVSANPTAGFSIVKYTATSDPDATVPHGLGVAPEMVFYKWGSSAWYCWTTVIDGSNDRLVLDRDDAKTTVSATYGSFTSSFIRGIDVSTGVIAYCFASIPNFSKIGVYTGNNAADGPMILTGFKPAWVMVKRTDAGNEWIILDVKRDIDNVASHRLFPNLADAESTSQSPMDILSNGFKLRTSAGICNAAGTYLYMAFAEAPFKYANAR